MIFSIPLVTNIVGFIGMIKEEYTVILFIKKKGLYIKMAD